jgi:hypothetical protein
MFFYEENFKGDENSSISLETDLSEFSFHFCIDCKKILLMFNWFFVIFFKYDVLIGFFDGFFYSMFYVEYFQIL